MSYQGDIDKITKKRHGHGTYTYENSYFKYTGDWKDGVKHGQGILTMRDGSSYEGQFVNGEIEGYGIRKWPDGSTYKGFFHRGEMCGKGVYIGARGEEYEGDWVDNMREGRGILRAKKYLLERLLPLQSFSRVAGNNNNNDSRSKSEGHPITYEGEFHRHKFHGRGILEVHDVYRYEGQFKDGIPHGRGSLEYYHGGSLYNGMFEQGRRHGPGKFFSQRTGITYEGPWSDDAPLHAPVRIVIDETTLPTAQVSSVPEQKKKPGTPGAAPPQGDGIVITVPLRTFERGYQFPKLRALVQYAEQAASPSAESDKVEFFLCNEESGRVIACSMYRIPSMSVVDPKAKKKPIEQTEEIIINQLPEDAQLVAISGSISLSSEEGESEEDAPNSKLLREPTTEGVAEFDGITIPKDGEPGRYALMFEDKTDQIDEERKLQPAFFVFTVI